MREKSRSIIEDQSMNLMTIDFLSVVHLKAQSNNDPQIKSLFYKGGNS